MSTRCNIIVKDGNDRIYLYHHHDGYPMGVGTELQRWLDERFKPQPYFTPRWYAMSIATALVKGAPVYPFDKEGKKDDEYEITTGLHGDVEYVYVINCQARTLRCYEVSWDDVIHQDIKIQWEKVFTRRYLVHIPNLEEREAEISKCVNY